MYKYILLLSALACGFSNGTSMENLVGTPIEECINCICYAKIGSWNIYQCGQRLVTFAYWKKSGSLTPSSSWRPLVAFRSCKADANCILNTIKRHTEQFGELDCNVDGKFDCQDRFAIQSFKRLCANRRFLRIVFNRFHTCLPNVEEAENTQSGINQEVNVVIHHANPVKPTAVHEIEQDVEDGVQQGSGTKNNRIIQIAVQQKAIQQNAVINS